MRLESAPSLVFSKELYLKGSGQEELPYVQSQGQQLRLPGCDGTGMAERSHPATEVRGSGREEPPHIRGQG